MNFTPFGGHFPGALPAIQQFAAKFGQDNSGNAVCTTQNYAANRYTTNSADFGQQSLSNQQQMIGKYQQNASYTQGNYNNDKRQNYGSQSEIQQGSMSTIMQNGQEQKNQQTNHGNEKVKEENSSHQGNQMNIQTNQNLANTLSSWQSLASTTSVADYLSHLPASTLPLSLHHFLKYSAETIKKESTYQNLTNTLEANIDALANEIITQPTKKKKKKKAKEKKPRPKPGEIRLTTALDGSTLYCCPECHMAYPEKELLEQHLLGHTMERKFVCDICGAGLKRKDHLTRHKQSHNPERPHVCTVCLKAFKRKEQLTLHFVIHSGEKRHICTECGKGFYRKDHLRKHTRSHIARRVKAELSQQGNNISGMISSTYTNSQVLLS